MINYLFTKTPLLFLVQSYWRDEAFSYYLAKKNIWDILVLSAKDFSPPFYHFILHYWMKVFGNSEIAIRSLSLIFYWATVYLITHFLEDVFKMKLKKALFYTLFFALNPLLVYYALEGRMYTMFAFFASLSFYSLYRKKYMLYFVTTILGLYTHYFMVLGVIAQFFLTKSKKLVIPLIFFLPWVIFTIFNRGIGLDSFWIQSFSVDNLINFLGSLYTGYEKGFKFYDKLIFPLSIALWILISYGYLKTKNQKDFRIFKYFFVWSVFIPLFIVLLSFIKPIFLPRYLIFSTVGLVLLIIFIIDKLPNVMKIIVIAIFIAVTVNYNKLQIKMRTKTDMKKTVYEIKYLMKENDVVYVTSELDFFTTQYYLQENKVYIWGKTYQEIPNYVGKALIPENKIRYSLPFYPKRAFVLTPDGEYTIKALY